MNAKVNMKDQHENLFGDTEIAFRGKSDKELRLSYWLFKIMSSNFLTSIGPPVTNFALRIRLPVKGIIKRTVFRHFCGGENIEECDEAIKALAHQNVGAILDYSAEGENSEWAFDTSCMEILKTIEHASNNANIPFTVFKPTGLGRFSLFEKLGANLPLTRKESAEFEHGLGRMNCICTAASEADVKVLIDAEHSWIQNVIDNLAVDYMRKYNSKKAVIFNTYQLYRKDKLASLASDIQKAKAEGFILGAKLVRGAYMEIERTRAENKGYLSPIHETRLSTDHDFNAAIRLCLDNLNHVSFVAGTHNENSCRFLATEMKAMDISVNHSHIYFAQLHGMSDHLSFNLSDKGYNVAKYLPYGSVETVMPYLFRRAQENTSVAGQVGRELSLIIKEIKRRKQRK
jgi:proline dehydrogenase